MHLYQQILKYIGHYFTARNTRGFGVHSPFMFQFIQNVLGEKHYFYAFTEIEKLRKSELQNAETVHITDFGTGKDRESTVKDILKKSVNSARCGQLLFRVIHYFKFQDVLELGTSLGFSTSYLASSSTEIKCTTIEGSPEIASRARRNFEKLNLKNIELIVGNIDDVLPDIVAEKEKLDLVYVDANHTQEATLRYFEMCLPKIHNDSVMVFDDIHWSKGMEEAWNKINAHPAVTSTVDVFRFGIVFFNKNLNKKHYKVFY